LLTTIAPLLAVIATIVWALSIHTKLARQAAELARKLSEEQRRRELAEAGNAAKSAFLSSMSHELRAPMNGIISFAEGALKTDLSPPQRECLDRVLNSAEWLMRVVSDVLDFSQIEAAQLRLDHKEFSFATVLLSAVKMIETAALEKNLALTYKVDPRIPTLLCGDPVRLRQVLFNLLENAVRYTTSGSIMVSVGREEETDDYATIGVSIADTGIGIPAEAQQTIFEPFHSSRTGKTIGKGTGMGLSICKRLVEMMGGRMEVQSQLGAGSTFHFTVKLKKGRPRDERSEHLGILSKLSPKRLSILVVDDDMTNRRLITKLLESVGHQITPASSAAEALSAFSTDIFDLILLDNQLADMNELEAARNLRELEEEGIHTPIYSFREDVSRVDHERSKQKEINGYLSKPVQVDELLRIVSETATTCAVLEDIPRGS
jgi:two-component system, sensor histidine kinase